MKSIHTLDEGSSPGEWSPILTCIKSIQGSEVLWGSDKLNHCKRLSLKELKSEQILKYEDGFGFAVSLQDGSTLYVSSAITKHLGYPKDMLFGQCFMNFLYQKDHITFANHLTQGLNACFHQGIKDDSHLVSNTFFCRLRVYHGLKFGFGISEKKTLYKPFKVTLHVNDLIVDDVCIEKATSTLCVKATATPLLSAYQAPEEIPAMTSFSTRHTASCHFSHVDASAIPYLGYLPQDMIGYSVFDFYHIDDMPQLKDIYELVVKERGSSFRSKPYRFKVFNGCYITLETEWSCFINPWSRKLEFVVGQHRVLKGPTNINIFDSCNIEEPTSAEEIVKDSQNIQKEIRNMLAQPIKDAVVGKRKRFCSKRKRDLASFVYNYIDEEGKKNQDGKNFDCSSSDSDSVVMGDISPHLDSSAFSETPPSCRELRYKENIERFFASQPKTFYDASEECKSDEKFYNSDESRGNASTDKQQQSLPSTSSLRVGDDHKQQESSSTSSKYMSSLTNGDSGYKSAETANPPASTTMGDVQNWEKSVNDVDMNKYPSCMALTEESLSQHNRMNNKYVKHRKCKANVSHATAMQRENNWMKRNESATVNIGTSHKHRKCAKIQTSPTSHMPTQTENEKTSLPKQAMFTANPSISIGTHGIPMIPPITTTSPMATASSTYPSFGLPSFPYMSSSCAHGIPSSPYFIPVMRMDTLPYYPTVPGMVPLGGVPMWPYAPVPPHNSPVVFPTLPAGCSIPVPVVPTPQFSPSSTSVCGVQPSGATATTTVLTTTTTVAPGALKASENVFHKKLQKCNSTRILYHKDDYNMDISFRDVNKEKTYSDSLKDSSAQIDDSASSSFTPSSHSERHKSMDFGSKFTERYERPIREDPPWLAGVNLTFDVIFRYQMTEQKMEDVLKKDMEALTNMTQPILVNKQLELLKHEFEKKKEVIRSEAANNEFDSSTFLGLTIQDDAEKGELMDNEDNVFEMMVHEE